MSINSNIGELFQRNGFISRFKVLTLSTNPLSNYYLDDTSISTANVQAMTTFSDNRSDSIEEVDSLLMENSLRIQRQHWIKLWKILIIVGATCVLVERCHVKDDGSSKKLPIER